MSPTLEVSFHGMAPSAGVETAAAQWLSRLTRAFDRIEHCRVSIDPPHQHRRHGPAFKVSVMLHVPGHEIVASREPGRIEGHGDVYLALADAFTAARRRLREITRIVVAR
jgi:ribosome-associated translation inhibitor RaiA